MPSNMKIEHPFINNILEINKKDFGRIEINIIEK